MIEFLSKWIEGIIIAISIVSIIEMILPNGNIKKYIKIVLSVYVIFSIISPFVNSKKIYSLATKEFNSYIETSASNYKENTINNTYEDLYTKELENDLKERIKGFGYNTKKCIVQATFDRDKPNAGINKIYIVISDNNSSIKDIDKIQINNKEVINTNINSNDNESMKKIRRELSKIYEIDENIIYITEE